MPMNSDNYPNDKNGKDDKIDRMKHYATHDINAYVAKAKHKEQG
jgi:hypothetical protein